LNKVTDICRFEGQALHLTPELIDLAWGNYFGLSHAFESHAAEVPAVQSRSVSAV
jgi:hypothetical protein